MVETVVEIAWLMVGQRVVEIVATLVFVLMIATLTVALLTVTTLLTIAYHTCTTLGTIAAVGALCAWTTLTLSIALWFWL